MENRPNEAGRQVVVRWSEGEPPGVVSPPATSVRSRVHEYGGGAYCVVPASHDREPRLAYVDHEDQRVRLCVMGPGQTRPEPPLLEVLSGEAPDGERWNHGDLHATPDGRWVLAVRERLVATRTRREVVAMAVGGKALECSLLAGRDFFSSPRPDLTGRRLAWVCWDHPDMPWDSSELWVSGIASADGGLAIVGAERVAGGRGQGTAGEDVSVGQPMWCAGGALLYVADEGGWWQPHLWQSGDRSRRLSGEPCEFHRPDWALGQATLAELPDGTIVGRRRQASGDSLVILDPSRRASEVAAVDQPCVSIDSLCAHRTGVAWLGSTPFQPAAVWCGGGDGTVFPAPVSEPWHSDASGADDGVPMLTASSTSVARPFACTDAEGRVLYGLFYAPRLADHAGGAGELPPLVMFCHGGPTAEVDPGFDPVVQLLTTRGLAVAAVDYAGSSGHGRSYRRRLEGRWGEADADDCIAAAAHLAAEEQVDGRRMAVRGSSAGGFTALCAMARSELFAAAVSWYGVTDLAALNAATHDFESRYTERLVGPWPAAAEEYRRRSPVSLVDKMQGAVLILQGLSDPVVPPEQATAMVAALRRRGVRCDYLAFEGESHGFRRAQTLREALAAEVSFYQELFAC